MSTSHARQPSASYKMHRQDSGYESQASCRRSRNSHPTQHSSETSLRRIKTRASTSSKTATTTFTSTSTYRYTSSQTSVTYPYPSIASPFDQHTNDQTPSSPLFPFAPTDLTRPSGGGDDDDENQPQTQSVPLPPPTTHYWTSDDTRRIEYAEIDAANKGLAGWLRRHFLPDCFTGCSKHIAFDDDSGSVRRYRLELEEPQEKVDEAKIKKRHLFSRL